MRVEESLNVRFGESPPPKSSPLVDDDILESEIIENLEKYMKIKENEPLNKEIVNIKETKDHPIDLIIEPKNVKEAIQDESWTMAIQEELNQFKINNVWSLVPPPDNQTIRARLDSIRILLAYACARDFKLFQMDIKSAFLNGFINEEVYVAQPPGFVDFEKPNHITLYLPGKRIHISSSKSTWTTSSSDQLIKTFVMIFQIIMYDEFELSMMGELNFFLSLQIKQLEDGIFFNQSKYIKEMLKKFRLEDAKPIKTPMLYETKLTRDEDGESIDDKKYHGMIGTGVETIVYTNSDHAGDYVNHQSISDVCTFMGCCLTSWFFKNQTALAISTTKAEYVSAEKACQQALWIKQALVDYDIVLDDIPVLYDNKGSIDLSKNRVLYSRTKHIEIRHHFLCDNVQKGNISIEKVSLKDNIADILTKPLKREPFNLLRLGLSLMEPNA
ncbi:retrovirus-related pol polyprotein from transposon TNT 1-94 [Tanacetum coccineum]